MDVWVMSERINAQDAFLNYVRRNRIPVTVFLLNGVKLNGLVSCFDYATVVLRRDGYTQLVYKHAISTFSPHSAVSLFDSMNGGYQPNYQQHEISTLAVEEEVVEEDVVETAGIGDAGNSEEQLVEALDEEEGISF
jgi:host factor-I protein